MIPGELKKITIPKIEGEIAINSLDWEEVRWIMFGTGSKTELLIFEFELSSY